VTIEGPCPAARLASIQYLRGLAACGVLAFHAVGAAGGTFETGAYGVSLFFVISGFIMVWITGEGSRPRPFLRDRLRRIVPLYWLATAIWLLITSLASGKSRYDPVDVALSLLFFPHGQPGEGRHFPPVLQIGWTLNYEALFYALVAVSLLFPSRWRLWAMSGALIGAVGVGHVLRPSSPPLAFWTDPILLHFLVGAWLAAAFKPDTSPRLRTAASAMVVAIVIVAPPTDLAVLLVAGGLTLDLRGRMPRTRLLLVGDASYSIYLFHMIGIVVCAALASRASFPGPVLTSAVMTAGLAAGLLAYWLLERPIQRRLAPTSPYLRTSTKPASAESSRAAAAKLTLPCPRPIPPPHKERRT
jgi:exopolysaccharide production protein ExoZ